MLLEPTHPQKGLAIVMHGLGGFKEQPHIETFSNAFNEKGISTIRFDTTNTIGESGGKMEDATLTNYYEDLEDVIEWATTQKWYREPFYLAGHSLGAIAVALYAEKHPQKIMGLAPISTVVSGKLSEEGHLLHEKKSYESWRDTGWREDVSYAKPGLIKKLKWSHMEDRLKYDLLPEAHKLTMPVLLIVGEEDVATLPEHQQILFDALPGKKEIHKIVGAPHTFRSTNHLNQIKQIFLNWIDAVEKDEDASQKR